MPAGDAMVRIAAVTQENAQLASTATITAPAGESAETAPANDAVPLARAAPAAEAQAATTSPAQAAPAAEAQATPTPPTQAASAPETQVPTPPTKPAPMPPAKAAATTPPNAAGTSAKPATTVLATTDKMAGKPETSGGAGRERVAVVEPRPVAVRSVGRSEVGTAAWYGGRYIGRRTTSGETLDTVHATAAHRTLPLNSLARVTNLQNGRSVVVRVTDRGPVNNALLIDMSPRAADELAMKDAGLARVKVEQVVELPRDSK